jgi:cytochrome c oxidase assembly protein Cox11
MSKYRNKYEIFCDAYGSYVKKRECKKCKLKNDCVKVKLHYLKNKALKWHTYPEQATILIKPNITSEYFYL